MKPLDKIVETLIINGTITEQPGLFYGKTGVAVFFFHYARHIGNGLFQDYAIDLIEEIQKQITVTTSIRYDTGISGIGAGFGYLLQNGFIASNEDEDIFEDLDDRMIHAIMYEPYPDLSLCEGLTGWGRYLIYRLRGTGQKNSKLHEALTHIANEMAQKIVANSVPENEQPDVYRFLHDMTALPEYAGGKYANLLQLCREWQCIRELDIQKIFPYMNNLQRLYACQNYFNRNSTEEIGQEWEKWKETDNNPLTDMGLLSGWATEGLFHLTYFHHLDNSWLKLL